MNDEQRQVASGMAGAAIVVLAAGFSCAATGWRPWGFGTSAADRMLYGAACTLPAIACLAVAIGSVAARRFFSPEDIGGALSKVSTQELRIRAAILQNTLEQTGLAVPAFLAAAMLLPERWLGTVAAASILFVVGRIGFARGYRGGAAKRAFGFGVGFYPSVLLVLAGLISVMLR